MMNLVNEHENKQRSERKKETIITAKRSAQRKTVRARVSAGSNRQLLAHIQTCNVIVCCFSLPQKRKNDKTKKQTRLCCAGSIVDVDVGLFVPLSSHTHPNIIILVSFFHYLKWKQVRILQQ